MSKPKRSIAHVVPEPGAGKNWCIYYYSADDPVGTAPGIDIEPTKTKAVKEAVVWAKDFKPSQVFIHNGKGQIVDERTYGSDPNPPAGAKRRK